jgi:glyoxylase-like metal-dependent hydrolase (beta-lactamase superfamily II)
MKLCTQINASGETISVIVVNDTGLGTDTMCNIPGLSNWNISTYIARHMNPTGELHYLVLLSHCHYDHILGLERLLGDRHVTVLSSSYDTSFVTPYKALQEHSLCASMNMRAPVYATEWAGDYEQIVYSHPQGTKMKLPIITIHTPGHTPDSLSWYDTEERTLYVGDSFYYQESSDTRNAPWGPEPPAAILFPSEGDLAAWWLSLSKLIAFVDEKNCGGEKRVVLSASHTTTCMDAATLLENVKEFMGRVLRDEIPCKEGAEKRGERFGYWGEDGREFKLGAPLRIVGEGRARIPRSKYNS